jgi:two-component system response regulator RegX3
LTECLIIDDDISIAKAISEYFNLFNLSSDFVTNYESGLRIINEDPPSIVILDVNLGDRSGFELCKEIRKYSDVPLIFISARDTDDDLLAALGTGGDDYITKPFSMAVLLAKTKAILKRNVSWQNHGQNQSQGQNQAMLPLIRFGDIEIDRNKKRVFRGGESVKIKPMELKLLLYLFDNQARCLTKDELLENVWGDTFVGDNTVNVHIRHLREKLEDVPNEPQFIKTMWGSGYIFEV